MIYRDPVERLNSLYKYQIQAGLVRHEHEFWNKLLKNNKYFVHKNPNIRKLLKLGLIKIVSFDELRAGTCKVNLFDKTLRLSVMTVSRIPLDNRGLNYAEDKPFYFQNLSEITWEKFSPQIKA